MAQWLVLTWFYYLADHGMFTLQSHRPGVGEKILRGDLLYLDEMNI